MDASCGIRHWADDALTSRSCAASDLFARVVEGMAILTKHQVPFAAGCSFEGRVKRHFDSRSRRGILQLICCLVEGTTTTGLDTHIDNIAFQVTTQMMSSVVGKREATRAERRVAACGAP